MLLKNKQRERELMEREIELGTKLAKVDALKDQVSELMNKSFTKFVKVDEVDLNDENQKMAYWETAAKLLENKYFMWMICEYREMVISQLACDMPQLPQGIVKFLANGEQVAGAIKSIDFLMGRIEEYKKNYLGILQAQTNAAGHENDNSL